MDGSIADATSLRMRYQLQRAYHGTTERPDQGFFEELMKLPVAPSAEKESVEPGLETEAASDQLLSTSGDEPTEHTSTDTEDEEKTQEPVLTDNMVMAYYAPLPYDLPTASDPPPRDASACMNVINTPKPTFVEAPPISNEVPTIEQAPIIAVSAELPATAPPIAQPSAQPVSDIPIADSVAVMPVDEMQVEVEPSSPIPIEPVMERQQPLALPTPKLEPARPNVEPTQRVAKAKPEPLRHSQPVNDPAPAIAVSPAPASASERAVVSKHGQEDIEQPVQQATAAENEDAPPINDTKSEKKVESSEERDKWYMSSEDESQLDAARDAAEKHEQADDQESSSAESRALFSAETEEDSLESTSELTVIGNADVQLGGSATQSMPAAAAAAAIDSASSPSSRVSSGGKNSPNSTTPAVSAAGGSSAASARRSTGEADASSSKSDARQLSQQERVRLVQRVARSFSRLGPEGGQVTLKLNPPELGVLSVSIRIEGQSMSARLQTQTTAARDVILENLPVLRERLAEQGIEVEKFQVDVNGGDNSSSGQSPTSSGGETGRESRSSGTSSAIDYRRLSRNSVERPALDLMAHLNLGDSSLPGRSLDIRA